MRVDIRNISLWLYASSVPFMAVGPRIADGFTLAPAYVFSAVLIMLNLSDARVGKRDFYLFAMLMTFLLSSVSRHSPATYLPSLILLTIATLPTTRTLNNPNAFYFLKK